MSKVPVTLKPQRALEAMYVKAINERKEIENSDRQLISDLMHAN